MIWTLIISWILTWFGIDDLIITGINELFNTDFTVALYWLIAFTISVIIYIVNEIKY